MGMSLDHIWTFVVDQVQTNQFSQGAIVAAVITSFLVTCKSIPGRVYNFLKRVLTTDVRFNSDSNDYEAISRFISSNLVSDMFTRNFVFQTETGWDRETYEEVTKHRGLTAGYGTHLGFYRGRPVIVQRYVDESAQTTKFKEHTVVTFLTRSKKTITKFATEVKSAAGTESKDFTMVPVHINSGSYWERMGKLPLRSMSSVFTSNNAGQTIVNSIRKFEASRDEHHRLGLPHHMGIMLHGKPGCGKSSLIHAVASELERSIYYLNLGSVEKDKELTSLLSGMHDWSKVILAIEDIDAAGVKLSREDDDDTSPSAVTLSALLNTLDGILCPDGLVVIATTNHHDRLDEALTREGRFDHTVKLGNLDYADFERMAKLFGKDPLTYPVANDTEMTGAAMRAMLMEAA